MSDDDNQPGTNLANGSVIFVALVALGLCCFFYRESAHLSSFAAMTEASILVEPASAQQQKVDARLWQDPFTAVAKSIDKLEKSEREQRCMDKQSGNSPCNSPLTNANNETLVIGVTTTGGAYAEDVEHRRRTVRSVSCRAIHATLAIFGGRKMIKGRLSR